MFPFFVRFSFLSLYYLEHPSSCSGVHCCCIPSQYTHQYCAHNSVTTQNSNNSSIYK